MTGMPYLPVELIEHTHAAMIKPICSKYIQSELKVPIVICNYYRKYEHLWFERHVDRIVHEPVHHISSVFG